MLDQLKRRCTRLLIENKLLYGTPTIDTERITQRMSTAVGFNSKTVHHILAHWHHRSALAPIENATADTKADGVRAPSKLSLLVWKNPRCIDEHGHQMPHASVDPWHVIPVTQHEALQFQHIPVGLRDSIISAQAKQHIDQHLAAMRTLVTVGTSSLDEQPQETDVESATGDLMQRP